MDISRYRITVYRRDKYGYYAKYYDKEMHKTIAEKSINALASTLGYNTTRKPNKNVAMAIAFKALEEGLIGNEIGNIPFVQYLTNFWNWDTSDYIKEANELSPNSVGKDHADNMLSCIENHVAPLFSDKIKLSEIKAKDLKKTMLDYFKTKGKGLAPATKNKIVSAIKKPCSEAFKNELINSDPSSLLPYFKIIDTAKPGLLSDLEVYNLLSQLLKKVSEEQETEDPKYLRMFLLIAIAFLTGERPGEIRALRTSSIILEGDIVTIRVCEAISRGGERKKPKNNETRINSIPSSIGNMLFKLASLSPIENNGIVFWSPKKPSQPIGASYARDLFYSSLEQIGITEADRKERHLILYGARHYFNNTLRFILSNEELREWMGHSDERMTINYSQPNSNKATEIGIKVAKAIPLPNLDNKDKENGKQ